MSILTFDTEEWYLKNVRGIFQEDRYDTYDNYLDAILNLLDEQRTKATFFCVGGLARKYPDVVRKISEKGHEIGCHSDEHIWLSKLTPEELKADTKTAIKSLENVTGKKVISYRAPAFSIGKQNKWALEVLAECGIERDASIYPAARDFGGFDSFSADEPCIINVGGCQIKEFPIPLTKIARKEFAYSGGGYFRLLPFSFVKNKISKSDYSMCYFHIADLLPRPMKMMDRVQFENYFKVPGTLKNRAIRMLKMSYGTKNAFANMCDLVRSFDFVNLEEADKQMDWSKAKVVQL